MRAMQARRLCNRLPAKILPLRALYTVRPAHRTGLSQLLLNFEPAALLVDSRIQDDGREQV
jgi:hypothetical protein